jgi:large subunit ribosomal protein L4
MPRKMRQAALRSALTVKAQDGGLVVIDRLALEQPKTRDMAEILARLTGDGKALVVLEGKNENVELSTNNIPSAKILRVNYLNIRDLLDCDKVLIPLAALDVVAGWLGHETGPSSEDSDALS